jgi:hypothetical protein
MRQDGAVLDPIPSYPIPRKGVNSLAHRRELKKVVED